MPWRGSSSAAPVVSGIFSPQACFRMGGAAEQKATTDDPQNRQDDLSLSVRFCSASVRSRSIELIETGTVVEMRIFNYSFLAALALFSPISAGCSNNAQEKVTAVVVTPVSESSPAQPMAEPNVGVADPESSPSATEEDVGKDAFHYPFPDREELFQPPTKKPLTHETRVKRDEDVVLMGFADVEGVRTVLKIDGIVTSLRVGESRGDVRVLAIEPPEVNLQRGERQWTESLADTR